MICSLLDWQEIIKPREELLYNCSEFHSQTDEWVSFTIGIGYKYIHYSNIERSQLGSHSNLVLCAFADYTDTRRRSALPKNRRSILQTLARNNINNVHIDPSAYFYELPNYKFVISPEGNGIDCHRHYEALMAGCIPIVENCDGIREKYGNCPILYTDNYSEITPEFLTSVYDDYLNRNWDFSRLFLSTYDEKEQNEIHKNGNYWSHKLTGMNWYR